MGSVLTSPGRISANLAGVSKMAFGKGRRSLWIFLGPIFAFCVLFGGWMVVGYHDYLLSTPRCRQAAAAYWDFEDRAAASRAPLTQEVIDAGLAVENRLARETRNACDGDIPNHP